MHLNCCRAFNAILARTRDRSCDTVILHLKRRFCLPVLLYGFESISDNSIFRSVQICWSRILFRVLKISSVDNDALVCHYVGIFCHPSLPLICVNLEYNSKQYRLHLDNQKGKHYLALYALCNSCYLCHIVCTSMFLIRR